MLGSIDDVYQRQKKRTLTSFVHACHLKPRHVTTGPDITPGRVQTTFNFKDLIRSPQHLDEVGRAEIILTTLEIGKIEIPRLL